MQLYGVGILKITKPVMYILLNNQKEPIAYIENMMILDATKQSVIGIIIGDCFLEKGSCNWKNI